MFERRSFAPVKEGEVIDLTIEQIGEKGDGIGKIKGFVIFVKGAQKDQTYKVKVTRVLKKCGFGEIVGEGAAEEANEEPTESEEEPSEDSESSEDSEDVSEDEEESDEGEEEEL